MISEEQLQELRDQIAKDEGVVATLRMKRFVGAGAEYAAAKGRIELATDALADLTAQYDAEQAALADRPNREKAEAKFLDGAARALGKADDRITAALDAAQAALVELVDAVQARSTLVQETHSQMAARGFQLRDGDGMPAHQTGTEQRLDGPVVSLRGRRWTPLQPLPLLDWLKHRVMAARMPGTEPGWCGTCRNVEGRDDSITDRVKDAPAVPRPEPVRVRTGVLPGAIAYISDVAHYERKIEEEELQRMSELFTDENGQVRSRSVPPTDEQRAAAAHRKKLLHDGIKAGTIVARH
ncbi:hypothetical protein NC239_14785 [Streptomyces sp. G3]|uniref:hypothetical protein n=1 Tax=Streptomyces sp. G3 TaxID=690144 RepID=UPI00202EAD00|nr:hypothetical protein [Streptomyces sp. G3]MCM1939482.1 hypothetical protein [Streptomyces sp. G3]